MSGVCVRRDGGSVRGAARKLRGRELLAAGRAGGKSDGSGTDQHPVTPRSLLEFAGLACVALIVLLAGVGVPLGKLL